MLAGYNRLLVLFLASGSGGTLKTKSAVRRDSGLLYLDSTVVRRCSPQPRREPENRRMMTTQLVGW